MTDILDEYKRINKLISDIQIYRDAVEGVIWRERAEQNELINADTSNEYGAFQSFTSIGYRLLIESFLAIEKDNLSNEQIVKFKNGCEVLETLAEENIESYNVTKYVRDITNYFAKKVYIRNQINKKLNLIKNDKAIYLPLAPKGHAAFIKYHQEKDANGDKVLYRTEYNAGYGIEILAPNRNPLYFQQFSKGKTDEALRQEAYGVKRVKVKDKVELKNLLQQDYNIIFLEFGYHKATPQQKKEYQSIKDKINGAIENIDEKNSVRVTAQVVGNCNTRSMRELLRDNNDPNAFHSFFNMILSNNSNDLLEVLTERKAVLEKQLINDNIIIPNEQIIPYTTPSKEQLESIYNEASVKSIIPLYKRLLYKPYSTNPPLDNIDVIINTSKKIIESKLGGKFTDEKALDALLYNISTALEKINYYNNLPLNFLEKSSQINVSQIIAHYLIDANSFAIKENEAEKIITFNKIPLENLNKFLVLYFRSISYCQDKNDLGYDKLITNTAVNIAKTFDKQSYYNRFKNDSFAQKVSVFKKILTELIGEKPYLTKTNIAPLQTHLINAIRRFIDETDLTPKTIEENKKTIIGVTLDKIKNDNTIDPKLKASLGIISTNISEKQISKANSLLILAAKGGHKELMEQALKRSGNID
jgi:hypothetical protein